ncbi:hypothetical protein [Agromyces sp. GXQ0307]|uniref:hypothetical protein n=1 Tax=Agromyces sp. GXQ0307 TaxID=3377835 RepID=UPI00383B1791
MNLAWRDAELHRTCLSSAEIARRWPASEATVQDLLATICHARDLAALQSYRSLQVQPVLDPRRGQMHVTVRLEEVEMHGSALTKTGERIIVPTEARFWDVAGQAPALLVENLNAGGTAFRMVS